MSHRPTAALTLAAALVLPLAAACVPNDAPADDATAAGAITVSSTADACDVSTTEAASGTLTFTVTNDGQDVTEFYLLGEDGLRVVSEVENIGPGLSRDLVVQARPGTYWTACKPGMVGDGIRGTFTVTGTAVAGSADQKVATAISDYKAFVAQQSDELLAGTEAFVAAVKDGDVVKAKELYPTARLPWETIEPVAESFGDLDPRIDGREDVVEEGMKFTGYHRLEKDLWVSGLQKDSNAIADQLLADVKEIAAKSKTVEPTALTISNGAKALLDEVATGKITGEEERYSHTDLWDFRGNLQGSQEALETLRPVVTERAPELQKLLDARFGELNKLLDSHREAGRFVSYKTLTAADIKALTVALDALSEQVAKVPGVVEAK